MSEAVFLSYSRVDRAYVEALAAHLAAEGVEAWWDFQLVAGDRFASEIQQRIDVSEVFLLVLSPSAVASKWVQRELHYADEQDKKIIPLLLEDCSTPFLAAGLHYEDVRGHVMPSHQFVLGLPRQVPPRPEETATGARVEPEKTATPLHTIRPHEIEWPLRVGVAPPIAAAYQERPDLQRQLATSLDGGHVAILSAVVSGAGGTGKTQLAATAYREALLNPERAQVLVWTTASSRDSVIATYSQAWSQLRNGRDPLEGRPEDQARAFVSWLAGLKRKWLVFLDDVMDFQRLGGLFPQGVNGKVIITTRRRDIAINVPRAQRITVPVFTDDQAIEYLNRKLMGYRSEIPDGALAEADDLARDLGRLPLALAQAGAVVVAQGWTYADYRTALHDRASRLKELFPPSSPADSYEKTVESAWSLAVQYADTISPHGCASSVLQVASVLDPNGIPGALFSSRSVIDYVSAAHQFDSHTADAPRAALRNLHRVSLVTHEPSTPSTAVRVHALVQRSTIESLVGESLTEVVRAAADALVEIWPEIENEPTYCQVLRSNALHVTEHRLEALWQPGIHALLFRLGRSLGDSGQAGAAVTYFQSMADTASRLLGVDTLPYQMILHDLAWWTGLKGDIARAIEMLQHVAARYEELLGTAHLLTLNSRHSLAVWQGQAGAPDLAARELREIVDALTSIVGTNHPDTLNARHELARWLGTAGDANTAAMQFAQLLTDRILALGVDHPDTLTTKSDLFWWRGAAGDAHAAAEGFASLVHDRNRVLGAEHPDSLTARHNYAWWRGAAGEPAEAAGDFETILADRTRILGADDPDTLLTRHDIAWWYGLSGHTKSAAAQFDQLVGAFRKVFGNAHPDTFSVEQSAGWWNRASADDGIALAALREKLGPKLWVLGPGHPATLTSRSRLTRWRNPLPSDDFNIGHVQA